MMLPEMRWGELAKLARLLGRPKSTVSNWNRFGVPKPSRDEVLRALVKLKENEYEQGQVCRSSIEMV